MSDLPLGMTRVQAARVKVESMLALKGCQCLTTDEAWVELTGWKSSCMDDEERRTVEWILRELGYVLLWTRGESRYVPLAQRWCRESWGDGDHYRERNRRRFYRLA